MSEKECVMWVLIVLFIMTGITISISCICDCIEHRKEALEEQEDE